MMRLAAVAVLFASSGCVRNQWASDLAWTDARAEYGVELSAQGDKLTIRVNHRRGTGIVRVVTAVHGGYVNLFPQLGYIRNSGRTELTCEIDERSAGPDWPSKVLWVDPDGPASRVEVSRSCCKGARSTER